MAFLITDKAELAFVAALETAVAPVPVVTGKATIPKTLPIVICSAEGEGDEEPKGTGNFYIHVKTEVKTNAYPLQPVSEGQDPPDEKRANEAIIDDVFSALQVDNLPQLLTGDGTDFFVFPNSAIVSSPQAYRDESGIWTDSLTIRIYCCGANLT